MFCGRFANPRFLLLATLSAQATGGLLSYKEAPRPTSVGLNPTKSPCVHSRSFPLQRGPAPAFGTHKRTQGHGQLWHGHSAQHQPIDLSQTANRRGKHRAAPGKLRRLVSSDHNLPEQISGVSKISALLA